MSATLCVLVERRIRLRNILSLAITSHAASTDGPYPTYSVFMIGARLNLTVSYFTASTAGAVTVLDQDHGGDVTSLTYNMKSIVQ